MKIPSSRISSSVPTDLTLIRHNFATLREARISSMHNLPLVIYRDVVNEQAQRVANHHEDFCSLYVIRSGRGVHVIDNIAYGVARGDVYVMGPGMTHWFRNGDNLTADTLHFSPVMFREEERTALSATPGFHSLFVVEGDGGEAIGRRWLHLTPTAYNNIAAQITELRTEWQRGEPDSALLARILFLRLLVHLSRFFAASTVSKSGNKSGVMPLPDAHEDTIVVAVRYMEAHFTEPLRIEQVAAVVHLSPDRFTEVFARAMGRTPRDYLRHLRLEKARTLLTTTENSVEEIARLSGFGNAAYLARVLKTAIGQTPLMVRKQQQ